MLLIDTASLPLIAALAATGKIKWYQISVGGLLLLNVPVSYFAFRATGQPEVFLFVAIILSLVALALRLLFLKTLVSLEITDYCQRVALPALAIGAFSFTVLWLAERVLGQPGSLLDVFVGAATILPAVVVGCFVLGATRQEKIYIFNKVMGFFRR